jgi:hypothetical protein
MRPTSLQAVDVVALGPPAHPRAGAAPTRFLCAVVEAVLPEDADADPVRIARVTEFVARQIAALPGSLALLLRIGTTGFRALVAVRHLGGFCSLDLPTRRRVVRAWSYGWFLPARQMFRVLRGPALLAYYDLPESPA